MNALVAAIITLPSLAMASNIFVHEDIHPRIVGGFPGGTGAYPYFCHAITEDSVCGGSLVAPDVVLTVKSCESVFQNNTVFIGSNDRLGRDFAPSLRVSSLYTHPTEDLMLILLNETSTNALVTLSTDPTLSADERQLFTLGFGKTTEEDVTFSDALMEVDMFLLENDICRLQVGESFNETTQSCASFPFGGPCDGDEGAPLLDLITQVQSGVYSYNLGCRNQPSVYIRLSAYADWITDFICSNSTLPPVEICGETTNDNENGKKSKKKSPKPKSSKSKKSVSSNKSSKKSKGGKGSKDPIDNEMDDYVYMNTTHHFVNETHYHNATSHMTNKTSSKSKKTSFKKGEQHDVPNEAVTRMTHQQRNRRKRRQNQYPRIRGRREALS